MERRKVLVGGSSLAIAALAGCTSRANPTTTESDDAQGRTISVSASGSARANPDLARFQAGIEASGSEAASVRDELATRESQLRETLIDAGVDEDDITTARFDIREIQERVDRTDEQGERDDHERRVYYEGIHSLAVEIPEVDDIGEILDAAINGGADHVRGLNFTLTDERRETLRHEALSEALDRAEAEAEHVAENVDAEVVAVKHVDASGGTAPVVRHELDVADDAAHPETAVHPDDVEVAANVNVVVEIR